MVKSEKGWLHGCRPGWIQRFEKGSPRNFLEQNMSLANIVDEVKRIHVVTRENPIVNRLNKTKVEEFPNLRQQKEDKNKEIRRKNRAAEQQRVSKSPHSRNPVF